jgi:nucleotide-binding universal stress UspA family protein
MRVVVWIRERGWEACVDAAAALAPDAADLTLLAVPEADLEEVAAGGRAGLLGRHPRPPRGPSWDAVADEAAQGLLAAADERLGGAARTELRHGRPEREVVEACAGAGLLVLVRDGEARLGPKSLGRHARFVVDHAPCPVLLVWDGPAPAIDTLPPPPR